MELMVQHTTRVNNQFKKFVVGQTIKNVKIINGRLAIIFSDHSMILLTADETIVNPVNEFNQYTWNKKRTPGAPTFDEY